MPAHDPLIDTNGAPTPDKTRPRIVCLARIKDPRRLQVIEFYREDLLLFERLGFEVVTETSVFRAARYNADLLYAFWGASALPAILAWRMRGKPSVLSGAHGIGDAGDRALRTKLKWGCILGSALLADETLAVSKFELDDLRRFGVRSARLAYHAVDTDYYVPALCKSSRPSALTVGQLNPGSINRKGIGVAIASTALVRRRFPEYTLSVVGHITEEGRAWLHSARSTHDFTGVQILGEISRQDKRALLQSSWAYLQPSRYEAFGVAAAEAMACGTVPVYTNGGALGEIVGGSGVQAASRTPEAMADGIISLIDHPELRDDLEQRARERAMRFSRCRREDTFRSLAPIKNALEPTVTRGMGR